jgi:hypothetical protein
VIQARDKPPHSPGGLPGVLLGRSAATAGRLWRSQSERAAGPLAYAAGMILLGKLARAVELYSRTESLEPLLVLPLCLGEDMMLLATLALLVDAAARVTRAWPRRALMVLLLLPLAVLLPADVVAHQLTGAPITWQRLRGDEGATLADLDLLDPRDLIGGSLGIALCLLALWPAVTRSPPVAWLRRLARPRSLLLLLLAGYGLTLLQGALVPRVHGLGRNPLFVLAGSFVETPEPPGLALSERQWRALARPARPLPPPEPLPELGGPPPRNVVIFLAEGIGYKHTSFSRRHVKALREAVIDDVKGRAEKRRARKLEPTPHLLERWRRDGLVFTRYRANWHASIQAIFSIVCSRFPPMRGDIVRLKPRIDCGELSEVMRDRGLVSGLFHGGRFNFYNKLALLGRRGYSAEIDAEELAPKSRRRSHQWGIDDRAVAEATLEWVDSLPKGQRFGALLIPISAHYPYWVPRDFERPFPRDSRQFRFQNAVAFQDQVFEQLLEGFEKRGLYEDTLFVWLGDHGHYVAEPARATSGLRRFYEPNLHTPLVLINRRMFGELGGEEARRSSRIGGHRDLLPTVLDALGLPPDPRHEGQSLLSKDYENRRFYFAASDGRFVGLVEGNHKYVIDRRDDATEYYDLERDPDELEDLSDEVGPQEQALLVHYKEDALRFARAVRARIENAPVLDERLSVAQVYDRFMQHVQVGLRRDDTLTPCPRDDAGMPRCPGLGPMLRRHDGVVQREYRRCVVVPVPEEGMLELRVDDPDTAGLMTGTVVALIDPRPGERMRVVSRTDGKRAGAVFLTRRRAARPRHPRPRESVTYRITRLRSPKRKTPPPDAGAKPGAQAPPVSEICLQLTALRH